MNSVLTLEEEINKLFENLNGNYLKVSSILSKFNFSNFISEISYSKFALLSIIRLYVFRLIKGIKNFEKLIEYLKENEEEAFQLGLFKDENNKLEIPPKRTYNYYLQTKITKEQKQQLNLIAEKIISLATKNKIVLDLEIIKKTIREKKKNYDEEMREAVKLVKKLVYLNINLPIHHNAKFSKSDFLDVLIYIAIHNDFANNGAVVFKELNQDRETPSGDLMLYHLGKYKTIDEIIDMFNGILDFEFEFIKRNYNPLKFRKHDVAYDIHKIPYYGKGINCVCGGKFDRGTSNFFEFLTCSIVEPGKRFILDIIPKHPLNDLSKLMDKSLEKVKKKINIDRVYCGRGFNSAKIFRVLKKHNLNFLMPMVRTTSVKRAFDEAEYCKEKIFEDFKVGSGKNKEKVTLVLVDDEEGIKRAFVCNFDIPPPLAYQLYHKRWGIETSYRNLDNDFKPRTTTRNYNIRAFYFLFSCCLYNLWVLTNICVSLTLYGRVSDKPIITAKLFAVILYRVREEIT